MDCGKQARTKDDTHKVNQRRWGPDPIGHRIELYHSHRQELMGTFHEKRAASLRMNLNWDLAMVLALNVKRRNGEEEKSGGPNAPDQKSQISGILLRPARCDPLMRLPRS
jgi:hypothetical protein